MEQAEEKVGWKGGSGTGGRGGRKRAPETEPKDKKAARMFVVW